MKEHIFLPKPVFPRHVCYPDFIGGYSDFPKHSVNREYRSKEINLDQCYNLHLVLGGKGFLHTPTNSYELTRGQGFLYGPGLRQTYHSDSDDPWSIRWVHFYGIRLEELLNGKGIDEPWLFQCSNFPLVTALMDRLLQLGREYQVEDEHSMAATLYELLTTLQSTANQINVLVNQTAERIREAANYVRSHSHEHITLEQAAGIAGYSTPYFSRKFSQTFGMSFPEFLMESRLLHAKHLLATTNLSIKQITLETGFSQSSYFIRCFRSQENLTPLQFRNIHNLTIGR
ncbi:helix-turn-helix transcriptional regulator [Paenibacillus xylanilyticus]|uniref:AraC family transcriptional regulator n=1 Tax=Paenibacillus xylanilyticus TaxID=248903 RepID=A0A7Y6ETU1_9BACL|nr:AraC family transcriptional regulator [Paenibacillus xylanilyticus]NUU74921.1 AraC family transcriptional regulator [Paenibacillus xylanilyticus]